MSELGLVMEYFYSTSAVNADLSILLAATTGLTHFVTGIIASYSLAPMAGRLSVIDGTTTIFNIDILIQNLPPVLFPLDNPLNAIQGNSMEIRLSAGGALNTGKLNAFGFSRF